MPTTQPIRFKCGGCGFKIKVSAKHAGRKAKCPDCGNAVVVPAAQPTRPIAGGAAAVVAPPKPAPPKDDSFDLDGFALEEPVGYDLDDEDDNATAEEAEPAWMKHAHAADAQAASLPKLGHEHESAGNDKPSLWKLFNADTWGRIAVTGIAFMWLSFIMVAVFGIDIMSLLSDNEYDTPGDKATPTGMLIAAIVTTALLAPLGAFRYRRAWLMMTRGVRVPCMIVKTGKFSKNEMLDVTFQYTIAGKTYKPKMSVKQDIIDDITHLLVDPEKPKRCMLDQ